MDITSMTELSAVNLLLEVIGESPVNSLTSSGLADVAIARRTLQQVSREVQSERWHFNTEQDVDLTPDIDGRIVVPVGTLWVIENHPSAHIGITQRGNYLYDRLNRTHVFEDSINVTLVSFLDWEYLPNAAREYIAIKAARRFQNKVFGNETVYKFTKEDEEQSRAVLESYENEVGGYNILSYQEGLRR
jgi:hypothetical protein